MKQSEKHILFDVATGERTHMTHREIAELTGKSYCTCVNALKRRTKLRDTTWYVMPSNATTSEYKALMNAYDIPCERWIRYKSWEVSDYGRVRNFDTKELKLPTRKKGSNYVVMCLDRCHSLKVLVYKLFIGEIAQGKVVVHKNYNTWDCSIYNLKLIDSNNVSSYYKIKRKSNEIIAVDVKTNETQEYTKITEVIRFGYNRKSVYTAIMEKRLYKGCIWMYYEDYDENKDYRQSDIGEGTSKVTVRINALTGERKYYPSIKDAYIDNYMSKKAMYRLLRQKAEMNGYFYEIYEGGRTWGEAKCKGVKG